MATATESAPAPAAATTTPPNSSLYVGDLDRDVSEAQLFELFSTVSAQERQLGSKVLEQVLRACPCQSMRVVLESGPR